MPEPSGHEQAVIPVHAETAEIGRRETVTGRVTVTTVTHAREEPVEAMLATEQVEIERVAVNRPIDAVPAIREEGDTIVIPVVEEVLVTERRLVLKEEVRVRRVRTEQRHSTTVTLRAQEAVIARQPVIPATQDGGTNGQ